MTDDVTVTASDDASLSAHWTAAIFVQLSPSNFRLDAPLLFSSVAPLRGYGLALLHSAPVGELQFDLQNVARVDSAGLALLVDWLASARALGRKLRYTQLPQPLLALAKLSEVDRLLQGFD